MRGFMANEYRRNLGFIFAFQIFFLVVYLVATELNSSTSSSAEVLVFRRGHVPKYISETADKQDEESGANGEKAAVANATEKSGDVSQEQQVSAIPPQKDIFTWRDVVYDIHIKGEPRCLLSHISGWVKPGTLTALMGVSGAGKTTLLDVLAQRVSMGVITGDMLVNGKPLDSSFQRSTGYVQQQDLHLETTTVREALRFSAMLRQPKSVSKKEKYEFVEEVIDMLNMRDFSEAIVGVPGEGLNVEQRKVRLSSVAFRILRVWTTLCWATMLTSSPTKAIDHRSGARCQARAVIVSGRANIRSRFAVLLGHCSLFTQACQLRPSRPLYHPSAKLHPLPRIRPSPLPSQRR